MAAPMDAAVSAARLREGVRKLLAANARVAAHPAVARAFSGAAWLRPDSAQDNGGDADDAVRAQLQALAACLAHEDLAGDVVKHLRPFMLELAVRLMDPATALFERAADGSYAECADHLRRHEAVAEALAALLAVLPPLFSVAQQYFASAPCFFEYVGVEKPHNLRRPEVLARVQRIAVTAHRLVRLRPHELAEQWNWSAFFPLCFVEDPRTRWHAARATAVVLRLGAARRRDFLEHLGVGERDAVRDTSASAVRQLEMEQHLYDVDTQERRVEMAVAVSEGGDGEAAAPTAAVPFHPSLKNIFGVIVPSSMRSRRAADAARDAPAAERDMLVPTASTRRNLQAIAIALGLKRPVLVSGAGGAGKTALIRELARLSGNADLVELHLDDQIDSKTLLGAYVCTEVPGEFTWQPGALTTAILSGRWVVIEDIDRAPFEVLAALMPLLETREMVLPGRGERLVAHPNFQIFGTMSHGQSMPKGFQESIWTSVNMQAMDNSEVEQVVQTRFDRIPAQVVRKIMVTYNVVCGKEVAVGAESQPTVSMTHVWREVRRNYGRDFCLRDLLKWGKRICAFCYAGGQAPGAQDPSRDYITEDERLRVLMEAFDVFCAGIRDPATRLRAASAVGAIWDVQEDKIRYCLEQHKPHVSFNAHEVEFGRVHLPTVPSHEQVDTYSGGSSVVMTGHVLRLLERLAAIVYTCEPALLIGETGCGKTTVIQHLAGSMGQHLVVQNLNVQSDSSDLVGGFKPVEIHLLARPLYMGFVDLFALSFAQKSNAGFLNLVRMAFERKEWKKMVKGMRKAVQMAASKFRGGDRRDRASNTTDDAASKSAASGVTSSVLGKRWDAFEAELDRFERQKEQAESHFAFSFVEGVLVKALREGHWVLLDEINLASSDTLERISTLLEHETSAFSLTERGDVEVIRPHPNFRIFGAMNPSTDVGKKDLPPSLRNRFTEIYVDECVSPTDLQMVVEHQFKEIGGAPVAETVKFYLESRKLAEERLSDGARHKPRYSLRTLSRALLITRILIQRGYGLPRALYEGFGSSFCTQLEIDSRQYMERLIKNTFAKAMKAKELARAPPRPGRSRGADEFVLVSSYWVNKGEFMDPRDDSLPDPVTSRRKFVLTKSVEENLRHVARAALIGRYPVLLQGPTSAGKTSLIAYMAARIGQKCVRINNHEHTDIQEYLGSYVSDADGKLSFKEGVLVEAVRNGWWIILDELNLAPSEVLEALNRLLDDNRELFLPETQETVKPHPKFMLFATQNPPGLYGGRKVLSRAFRNRFLEIQVDEVGTKELQTILQERSSLPPSYCAILIDIMRQLQLVRQQSSIFAGKSGFITTRDLLRWAERRPMTKQALAEEGYCLLAERLRKEEEKTLVKQVIEKKCNVTIDLEAMYYTGKARQSNVINEDGKMEVETAWGTNEQFERVQQLIESALDDAEAAGSEKVEGNAAGLEKISVTKSLRRLFALVGRCLQNEEPVLLVGETGCGKTTVCQLYSLLFNQPLHIINCHQHTETSDFLGCLRPVRGKEKIERDLRQALRNYVSSASADAMDEDESLDTLLVRYDAMRRGHEQQDGDAPEPRSELHEKIDGLKRRLQSIFEWSDGPLVESMKKGDLILIDEVNLAEDAVLERLNSVLEPTRTLLLAEKGGDHVEEIVAHPTWRVMATMNPGGDFGKRELSPALRNRFTEIWVPAISDLEDIATIIQDRLVKHVARRAVAAERPARELAFLCDPLLSFVKAFNTVNGGVGGCGIVTLRDILSWINFITSVSQNEQTERSVGPWTAFVQGAALSILDGLGLGSDKALHTALRARDEAYKTLLALVPDDVAGSKAAVIESLAPTSQAEAGSNIDDLQSSSGAGLFGIGPFAIAQGPAPVVAKSTFSLKAPTTMSNLYRVLRAMQVNRPIILEGSPGVGKTSLVSALAAASGHRLVRINLSEQTDISDLFGSDLPAASSGSGSSDSTSGMFEWCDGVFLRALKAGDWVLLDELNLASQSVLEGLNSCLDHRGTVYIPELDREFECPSSFRVFAAQNPLRQGGGRKGLPKSFLNRFTRVFVETLHEQDLIHIAASVYPTLHAVEMAPRGLNQRGSLLERMVAFNSAVHHDTMVACRYGRMGSPWEFNLRDAFRFCELLKQQELVAAASTEQQLHALSYYVNFIYVKRMRSARDRAMISQRFEEFFGVPPADLKHVALRMSAEQLQVGNAFLRRQQALQVNRVAPPVFDFLLGPMESLAHCVNMGWPALLVGPPASGKTSSVRLLAALTGNTLHELGMSAGTDATELLGCFEQVDLGRKLREIQAKMKPVYEDVLRQLVLQGALPSSDAQVSDKAIKAAKQLSTTWWALAKRENYESDGGASKASKNEVDAVAVDLMKSVLGTIKRATTGVHERQVADFEQAIDAVVQLSKSHSIASRFEWVDGTLIHAMEKGEWVLLDNVNFCSSSVLDRLNSLMETDGELLINECGVINGQLRVVKPHANFRLFLAMDAQFGEVSRAMRNRCIEIALLSDEDHKMDAVRVSLAAGIPGRALSQAFQAVHSAVVNKLTARMAASAAARVNRRHLENWSLLAAAEMARGISPLQAIGDAFQRIYGEHLLSQLELQHEALRTFETALAHSKESAFKQRMLATRTSVFELCQSPDAVELARDLEYVEYLVGTLFVTPTQEADGGDLLLDALADDAVGSPAPSSSLSLPAWLKLLALRPDQSEAISLAKTLTEARAHLIAADFAAGLGDDCSAAVIVAPFALRRVVQAVVACDGLGHGLMSEERLLFAVEKLTERVKGHGQMRSASSLLTRFLGSIVKSDVYASIASQMRQDAKTVAALIPDGRVAAIPLYLAANWAEFSRVQGEIAAEAARSPEKQLELNAVWASIVDSQDRLELLDGVTWLRFLEQEQLHHIDSLVGTQQQKRQNATSSHDLASFSVLQQSYAIHTYHFDRTDVENDIIVLIHPFFEACDSFLRAFMGRRHVAVAKSTMSAVKAMLRDRFELSLQLRGSTLDWMRFLIHWQWIRKALLRLDADLQKHSLETMPWKVEWHSVADMTERVSDSVAAAIGGTLGKSALWKSGSHALLPRTADLWQAHALLERLSQTFMQVNRVFTSAASSSVGGSYDGGHVDVLALLFGGVGSMEAAMKSGKLDISSLFFVSPDARKEVLQALCAFSYLTQEQLKARSAPTGDKSPRMIAEELYKLPGVLLSKLQEQQEATTAIISKQTLYLSEIEDNGQSFVEFLSEEDSRIGKDAPILLFDMKESAQLVEQLVNFQLSPLVEHSLARQEVAVIGQLLRLLNVYALRTDALPETAFAHEVARVLSSLESLVEGHLRVGLRDPSTYFAYQDLLWCGHSFLGGDDRPAAGLSEELQRFMDLAKTHLNGMLFGFHRFLRNNSFNHIDAIGMEIFDTQRKLRKASTQRRKAPSKEEEEHAYVSSGYPRLFQAVQSAVIMKCVAEVDLEDSMCATVETQIRSVRLDKLKEHLAVDVGAGVTSVGEATDEYLKGLFIATVAPFKPTFEPETWQSVAAALLQLADSASLGKQWAKQLLALLRTSRDALFTALIDEYVSPLLVVLEAVTTGSDGGASDAYGEALLLLGLWRFALVLPQSPVDPVTKPLVKKGVLLNRLAVLTLEDAADVAMSRANPLPSRSPDWRAARALELSAISTDIAHVSANAIQRYRLPGSATEQDLKAAKQVQPVPMSAYGELFRDLRRFQSTIMPSAKMLALLATSRSTGKSAPKTRDLLRELHLFQQASDSFAAQLTLKFGGSFRDVVEPVAAAIYAVKEGVAMLTWSLFRELQNRSVHESLKKDLALALAQFPSAPVPLQALAQHGPAATWREIQLMLSTIGSTASSIVFGGARHRRRGEIALLNVALARLELMFRAELSEASTALANAAASPMESAFVCAKALFDLFLSKWQEQKDKEEQRRKEEAEMFKYKVRNVEFETQEQLEEEEFRQQFPDYHASDFSAFLTAEQVAGGAGPAAALLNRDIIISDKMMQRLCLAHVALFAAGANSTVRVSRPEIVRAFAKAFSLASSMHQTINALANPAVERAVASSGVFAASVVQARIGYKSASAAAPPAVQALSSDYVSHIDFHRDPFVKEAVLVNEPLQRLLAKLQALLALWPDHAILQQLVLISDRIRNFEISSPLARTLTGVELLLRKAQEWEAYASRSYSIAPELGALSALVTRWRKLELYSWPHLLHVKERQHQAAAHKSWLNLYALLTGEFEHDANANASASVTSGRAQLLLARSEALPADLQWLQLNDLSGWLFSVGASGTEASVEAREAWLQQLFGTLDEYLRACPLGQFETRLLILYSFCAQFFMEFWHAPRDAASCSQSRYVLANLLFHLHQYYAQHLGFLGRQWSGLKAPIQRKLLEFVKIARWDEQTYYSLAESADKSHRKLMKFVRDYDTVLSASMQTVIDSSTDGSVSKEGGYAGIHATRSELSGLNDAVVAVYEPTPADSKGLDGEPPGDAASVDRAAKKSEPVEEDAARDDQPIVLALSVSLARAGEEAALSGGSVASRSQFLPKLPALAKRIAKFTRSRILSVEQVARRQEPRQVCEDLCESIFYRMDMLQKAEKLPKGAKKKALIDLLAEMKDQGMAFHRMRLPAQLQRMERLFELDVPDVENCIQLDELESLLPGAQASASAAAKRKAKAKKQRKKTHSVEMDQERHKDSLLWLWERADGYYYRFLGQLGALRFSAITSFSHDLSSSEVDRMSGYAENMLLTMLQQRQVLHAASLHHEQLVDALSALERLQAFSERHSRTDGLALSHVRDWQAHQVAAATALRAPLRELEAVVSSVLESGGRDAEAAAARARIQALLSAVLESYEGVADALAASSAGLRRSLGAPAVLARSAQPVGNAKDAVRAGDASLMAFAQSSRRVYGVSPAVVAATPAQLSALAPLAGPDALAANSQRLRKVLSLLQSAAAEFASVGPSSACFDAVLATCEEVVAVDESLARKAQLQQAPAPAAGARAGGEAAAASATVEEFVERYDKLVETVLVSIQDLTKASQVPEPADEPVKAEEGDEPSARERPRPLREQLSELNAAVKLARVNQVAAQLASALDVVARQYARMVETGSEHWRGAFGDSLAMLGQLEASLLDVRGVSRQLLVDYLVAHKSVAKLDFVLVRVFRNLLAHGFCRSEDKKEEEGEGGGEGKMQLTDDVEGTGMGEGEGKKDVSHEIEDEEQLLGLQGEEQREQDPSGDKPDDTGLEMQNDFEGAMQDVPEDEKEEDDDRKDEDEEELDREMGEFNQDDENVVDEKMWGEDSDDDEDQIDKDKEKFEEESKVEGSEPIEDEIRGKDGDEEEKGKKDKEEVKQEKEEAAKQPEQAKDDAGGDADEEEEDGDDGNEKKDEVNDDFEDKYEENHELDPLSREQGQEEEQADEDEGGELPDDMQLDGDDAPDGEDQDAGMDDDADDADGGEEHADGDEEAKGEPEQDEEMEDKEEEGEDETLDSAVPMGGGGVEDEPEAAEEDAEDTAEPAPEEEEEAAEDASAPSSAVAGTQSKDGKDELEAEEKEEADAEMEDAEARDDGGRDLDESRSSRAQQQSRDNADERQDWRRQSEVAPADGEDRQPRPQEKRRDRSEPNPYRNPVSAQEHWRKRVEMVEPASKEEEEEEKQPKRKAGEDAAAEMAAAEYVDDKDEDMEDVEHALAPADENQVMNEAGADEEKEDAEKEEDAEEDVAGASAMEVDEEEQATPEGEQSKPATEAEAEDGVKREQTARQPHEDAADLPTEAKAADEAADEAKAPSGEEEDAKEDVEEEEEEAGLPSRLRELELTSMPRVEGEPDERSGGRDAPLLTPEEVAGLRDELDASIAAWSQRADAAQRGAELWGKYSALTGAAAARLCEQLRLVLEPTLRAKLEGDFRTGKRINMRKVIPYIASQFRKDKIWLRRSRPSKRQYQVLVAIDDSESMADNHAGRLALEAMATLCRGMAQLEVGELAVAKFGERLELLHAFDAPWTDDAGGRVMAQFGFQQAKTHMVQTLDALLQVLEAAKLASGGSSNSNSSAVEFTQIVFLISDGRFDSDGRVRIRKLIETALERQQLIVLLIVDQAAGAEAQGAATSILETKSVAFVGGKVEMTPYLENYPFPYYVLLPASALLPEILADSLRQWFEMLQMKS